MTNRHTKELKYMLWQHGLDYSKILKSLSDSYRIRDHNHLVHKWTLNWPNDWAVVRVLICTVHLTVCYYHITYSFQSKSTLDICLNVKKLLTWNRHDIWSLSDCNGTRTRNHLVRKRTLNHLAKPWRTPWPNWLNVPLQSLKLQISHLLRATSSLTFRQI